LDTVRVFFDQGRSVRNSAKHLGVHPNTIRYRLRRVTELTGHAPTDARSAFVLQVALALGRLDDVGPNL
ncbi:MAG: helix-turn-helix domain-containing protein, partial [Micromonosporaceae bacterium]